MGTATPGDVVVDASVAVRSLLAASGDSPIVTLVREGARVAAPSLVAAEAANALLVSVRSRVLSAREASEALRDLLELPIELVPVEVLAADALALALAGTLSVYDACYVVLAEAREATLLTADRRLAAAYAGSTLVA